MGAQLGSELSSRRLSACTNAVTRIAAITCGSAGPVSIRLPERGRVLLPPRDFCPIRLGTSLAELGRGDVPGMNRTKKYTLAGITLVGTLLQCEGIAAQTVDLADPAG